MLLALSACGGEGGSSPTLDAGVDAGVEPIDHGTSDGFFEPDVGIEADLGAVEDMGTDVEDGGSCTCPEPTDCATYTCDDTFTCIPTAAPAGTICALDETTDGLCIEGTCTMRGCGDTYVERGPDPAPEGCDDGNTSGDDLCAADCSEPTVLELNRIGIDDFYEHNGYHQAPMIGVDGAGEVLVVWSFENYDGSMPDLRGRRFDRHGAPLGDSFSIHAERVIRPVVIGLPGGGFLVGYRDFDGHVVFRLISIAGTVGTERRASADPDSTLERHGAFAALATGGFVVAWHDGRDRFGVDQSGGVYYRRFSASGTPLDATDRRATADPMGRERDPRVASEGDTFAVTWVDEGPAIGERRIQIRRFSVSTGSAMDGGDLQVSTTGDFVFEPVVTALTPPNPVPGAEADGSYLLTWRVQGGAAPGIYARRFDVGETPTPAMFIVDGEEATVAPLQSIVGGDGSVARHYLLTYMTGEVFGGADVIATRPVPMAIDTMRAELDRSEIGFGVVAAPGGLWFHYFRSVDLNDDQLRIYYLPVP